MQVAQVISLGISFVLVAIIVAFSSRRGVKNIAWAYHIGDQPVYRLLFLVAILWISTYSFSIAIMLVLLYMMINSMVPVLSELDESFVHGPPLTSCNVYNKDSVQQIGTPFYPLHVTANALPPPPACVSRKEPGSAPSYA
jgi:hypothetical protein